MSELTKFSMGILNKFGSIISRFSYTQMLIIILVQFWCVQSYFQTADFSEASETARPEIKDYQTDDVIEPIRYFNMDEEFQTSIQSPQ